MDQPSGETYEARGRPFSSPRTPLAERRKIPVAERRKIDVAERRRIPVVERREIPAAGHGEVPAPQRPEVPFTQQHQRFTAGCRSGPAVAYYQAPFSGPQQQRTSAGMLLVDSEEDFSSGSSTPISDGGEEVCARYDALVAEQQELADSGENIGRAEMARFHEAVLRARGEVEGSSAGPI